MTIWSHGHGRSHSELEIYLHFHKACSQQTWWDGDIEWELPTFHVLWPFDHLFIWSLIVTLVKGFWEKRSCFEIYFLSYTLKHGAPWNKPKPLETNQNHSLLLPYHPKPPTIFQNPAGTNQKILPRTLPPIRLNLVPIIKTASISIQFGTVNN